MPSLMYHMPVITTVPINALLLAALPENSNFGAQFKFYCKTPNFVDRPHCMITSSHETERRFSKIPIAEDNRERVWRDKTLLSTLRSTTALHTPMNKRWQHWNNQSARYVTFHHTAISIVLVLVGVTTTTHTPIDDNNTTSSGETLLLSTLWSTSTICNHSTSHTTLIDDDNTVETLWWNNEILLSSILWFLLWRSRLLFWSEVLLLPSIYIGNKTKREENGGVLSYLFWSAW